MNRPRLAWLVVLVGCAALIGITLIAFSGNTRQDTRRTLSEARARWAARPFVRYQMHVQDICEQDITVEGTRVIQSSRTRCGLRGRTIDDLFKLIERDETVSYSCVANGCTCDDVISVQASYDLQFGYPTAIKVRVEARPNPAHADFWRQMWHTWRIPRCAVMDGAKTIRVMTLQPL